MTHINPNFDRTSPRPADSIYSDLGWRRCGGVKNRPVSVKVSNGRISGLYHAHLYSPEFLAKLGSEREWTAKPHGLPPLTMDQQEALGLGKLKCPRCNGSKVWWTAYTGTDTGLEIHGSQPCVCLHAKYFYTHWAKVPALYRGVGWDGLAPINSRDVLLSLARQREIIDSVKAAPDHNYLFFGHSRTGKTHISYALHRRALATWAQEGVARESLYSPVLRAQVTTLLDQHHAYKTRNTNDDSDHTRRPDIDVPAIRRIIADGSRPVIILDELDKLGNPTEFKVSTILSLLDEVHMHGGQIIATANRSPQWMANAWGQEVAEPIIYRAGGGTKGHTIFFGEKSSRADT